jgi:hypothetical protein
MCEKVLIAIILPLKLACFFRAALCLAVRATQPLSASQGALSSLVGSASRDGTIFISNMDSSFGEKVTPEAIQKPPIATPWHGTSHVVSQWTDPLLM